MNRNDRVYEKLSSEFKEFIEGLKQLPVQDVIERSYEKTLKEDIVLCFDAGSMELSPKEAKALLAEKRPLEYLYQEWLRSDDSYMDMLRDCLSDGIASLEKDFKPRSDYAR